MTKGGLTRRWTQGWRRVAAAVLAALAGATAAVIFATAGSASSFDPGQPQVQVFALPTTAYTLPLASGELPMLPAPDGKGEWLIVSGAASGTLLEEPLAGGPPAVVTSSLDDKGGKAPFLSLVGADGSTWTDADNYQMVGFSSSGSVESLPAIVKLFPFDARDLTADQAGNLYIPDNDKSEIAQALINLSDLSKSSGNLWTIPNAFATPNPQAVAIAGGSLWFTTNSGQLGSFITSNPNSTVQGPYSEQVNGNGHTLAPGSDGNLWAVGGGAAGSGGSDILKINPSNGQLLATYAAGLPSNPGISAITSGPDGNIWFTESGAGEIGQLTVSTGAITNYPLPAGSQLPAPGQDMIAPGPSASGAVFFAAQAAGGSPAVGEVGPPSTTTTTTTTTSTTPTTTSITTTTTTSTPTAQVKPGTVAVISRAGMSAKGVVRVHVSCRGKGGCSGRLTLLLTRKLRVRVHRRTVTKRVATKLGSARYHLRGGKSTYVSIKVSHTGSTAVAAAPHHQRKLTVKIAPTKGRSHETSLLVVGPTSKHR